MSNVTNLMLHRFGGENADELRIAELDEYFELKYKRAFISIHDETLPPGWYGGHSKGMEADVYLGVFSNLDLDALVDHLRSLPWTGLHLDLIVREQDDSGFRIIPIWSKASSDYEEKLHFKVERSRWDQRTQSYLVFGEFSDDGPAAETKTLRLQSTTAGDTWKASRVSMCVTGVPPVTQEQTFGIEAWSFVPCGSLRDLEPGEEFTTLAPAETALPTDTNPSTSSGIEEWALGDAWESAPSSTDFRLEHLPKYVYFGRGDRERDWTFEQCVTHCLELWETWGDRPACRATHHSVSESVVWTVREQYWPEGVAPRSDVLLTFIAGWKIEPYEVPAHMEKFYTWSSSEDDWEERERFVELERGYVLTPYSECGASRWLDFSCPLEFLSLAPAPNDFDARRWRREVERYHRQHPHLG